MSLKNFLPLRREVREHWTYKDNDYLKLWIEILFCARFSDEPTTEIYRSQLYQLNQGEFLFGRKTYAMRLKISEAKVRRFIELAVREDMIKLVGRVGKQGASIYSVTNYNHYNKQPTESSENKGSKKKATHDSPTTHPRLTTKEEGKKEKSKYTVEFESLYKAYPRSENKAQTYNNYNKLLKTHTHQELFNCVTRYAKAKKNKEKEYLTVSSNFFGKKAVYIDYLDENYKKQHQKEEPKQNGKVYKWA